MKRNIVIASVAVATLVAGGTAFAFASDDDNGVGTSNAAASKSDDRRDDDQRDDSTKADAQGKAGSSNSSRVTAAQAIDAALKAAPGTAVSADLDDSDDDGDRRAWEVDVLGKGSTWYEVHIDPATGKVLAKETDRDDNDDAREARTALAGSTVSAKKAAEIASAKGFVTSVDLDDDDRSTGWDVETTDTKGKERDWNVDLKSAKITADHDDRDDRGDDDADDRNDND
ncbi:PepSY domain-containing protein [Streptomyces sp. T-3]|nr:PepSY domain-containing protein [Streptomyces sp. T-3]